MVKVTVTRAPAAGGGKDGGAARKGGQTLGARRIRSIRVEGHAGYAKVGRDIVCAAASVTAYTAAGALSELAGLEGACVERDGYFEIALPDESLRGEDGAMDAKDVTGVIVDAIMETACIGYRQIAEAYPKHLELVCR